MHKEKILQQENNIYIGQTNVRVLSYKMRYWRWIVLGLLAIFIFSNLMGMSVMSSLQEQIINALDTDYQGYNFLQASAQIPNVINPFIAGILIDIIGVRKGILGYSTFILIGETIQYIATTSSSYDWMVVGIINSAIGQAALAVIIPYFVSAWFIGKQLSLGLATISASSSFGIVLANLILPPIYKYYQTITIPYLVCAIVASIGCISIYIVCFIDYHSEKDDKKRQQILQQQETNIKQENINLKQGNNQSQKQINDLLSINLQETLFSDEMDDDIQNQEEEKQEKVKKQTMSFKDLKKLNNLMFWLIVSVGIIQNIAMYTVNINLQHILIYFYGLEEVGIGQIVSAITLTSSVISPMFAFMTDKIGRRAECLIISTIIQCLTLLCWSYIPVCQEGGCYWFYIPIVMNGLNQALINSVFYPSVTIVVDQQILGSSFGISDCVKSLGLFITPFITGPVQVYGQKVNSYFYLYTLCLGISVIGFIMSVLTYVQDLKTGKRLNLKQGEYQQINNNEKIEEINIQKSILKERKISMTLIN